MEESDYEPGSGVIGSDPLLLRAREPQLDPLMVRALVCGGRDYAGRYTVHSVLAEYGIRELCHGAAPGADTLAGEWAIMIARIKTVAYPADWDTFGKAAGPIRNRWMLEDFRPNLVIAFPGGQGTANMVQISRAAGVRTILRS